MVYLADDLFITLESDSAINHSNLNGAAIQITI